MKALDFFFNPRSIAIVGATNDPKKLGCELTTNIFQTTNKIDEKQRPHLFLVNPSKKQINGLPCYPNLSKLPETPDLTLIVVPTKHVLSVINECASINTKAVIIITAGFGEINKEGTRMEQEFLKISRESGFRIIGPNCVGLINMDLPLNASFIKTPPFGTISMISQSGSFGAANIYRMHSLGIGIQKFVNLGNAIDVQPHEILEYLAFDKNTETIGLYLETLKHGRKFYEIAKRTTAKKPVIILKAGRTEEGQKSASSHTGALATDYRIFEGMTKQSRIHLVSDEVAFQAALNTMSRSTKLPKDYKVGIITNAGGPAVILSDLLAEKGIKLADLGKKPRIIDEILNPLVKWANPLDLIATARKDEYRVATLALLENSHVDIVVTLCVVPTFLQMSPTEHAEGVIEATRKFRNKRLQQKPIIMGWLAGDIAEQSRQLAINENIPFFTSIGEVVSAVHVLTYYIKKRKQELK